MRSQKTLSKGARSESRATGSRNPPRAPLVESTCSSAKELAPDFLAHSVMSPLSVLSALCMCTNWRRRPREGGDLLRGAGWVGEERNERIRERSPPLLLLERDRTCSRPGRRDLFPALPTQGRVCCERTARERRGDGTRVRKREEREMGGWRSPSRGDDEQPRVCFHVDPFASLPHSRMPALPGTAGNV